MSRQVKNTQLQLQQLSVDQLRSLKETMDNDIGSLSRAYDSIRVARNRFADGKTYLETFKAYKPEQEMLVPLSSSLYVPGKLADASKVLVDVGTGYYVQQSVPRAQEFFGKRMQHMKDTMDNINEAVVAKQKQQNMVIDVMRQKSQAMQAQEQ
jgi:prefoldin alpha subunit